MYDHDHSAAHHSSHNLAQGAQRRSSNQLGPPADLHHPALPSIIATTEGCQAPKLNFSCPYSKRFPKRSHKKRSCVYPGFPTIARLKEHLFRYHMLPAFRCSRCYESFDQEPDLEAHQRVALPCEIRERDIDDGFNAEQERKLRKKDRTSATHTEQDKWTDIYQTLFPSEQRMPSPYFHPPELDEYQQFCLDESGRVLRQKLDDSREDLFFGLGHHAQPQLLNLVHEIQAHLFEDFQARGQDDDHGSTRSLPSPSRSATPMTPFSFDEESSGPADDTNGRPSKRKRTETPALEQPFSNRVIEGDTWSQGPVTPQHEPPSMPPRIVVSPAEAPPPAGYGISPKNHWYVSPGFGGNGVNLSGLDAGDLASGQPYGFSSDWFDPMGGGYDPENLNNANLSYRFGS